MESVIYELYSGVYQNMMAFKQWIELLQISSNCGLAVPSAGTAAVAEVSVTAGASVALGPR